MSSGEYDQSDEMTWGEIVYLAGAIADRYVYEDQLAMRPVDDLLGATYPERTDEQRAEARLRIISLLIKQVENPDLLIELSEHLNAAYGDNDYEERAQGYQESGIDVTADELRRARMEAFTYTADRLGENEEFQKNAFATEIRNAQELAAEIGIHPARIFEDDRLYEELMRRIHTPLEIAKSMIDKRNALTADAFAPLTKVIRDKLPPEVFDDLSSEEIDRQIEYLITGTTFQDRIDLMRAGMITAVVELIIRLWGADAIVQLPDDIKAELIPPVDENAAARNDLGEDE